MGHQKREAMALLVGGTGLFLKLDPIHRSMYALYAGHKNNLIITIDGLIVNIHPI